MSFCTPGWSELPPVLDEELKPASKYWRRKGNWATEDGLWKVWGLTVPSSQLGAIQRFLILPTASEGGAELVLNILTGGDLTNLPWDDCFAEDCFLAVHGLNQDCWV